MNEGKKQLSGLGDTYKTVLEMFSGNGVALAMPFLHFAGYSAKTQGVFPQIHKKSLPAVSDNSLTRLMHRCTLPLTCHLRRQVLIRLNSDASFCCILAFYYIQQVFCIRIAFSQIIGVEQKQGNEIFLDLFLYSHGITVLTATGKLSFDSRNLEKMLQDFLAAYVKQERENAALCSFRWLRSDTPGSNRRDGRGNIPFVFGLSL